MAKISGFSVEEGKIPKLSLRDWVLAIIQDKEKRKNKDAIFIMNEVFIFVNEVVPSLKSEFDFKSAWCGPYSEKVVKSLEHFIDAKVLEVKESKSTAIGFTYELTESGAKKASEITSKLPASLRDKIEFLKTAVSHMGPTGMFQYIYSIYPEYVFLREGGENIV
ncbi:MAG: hypothetical protein JSW00_00385 [Thermoplasmata archaeon]|nr:MAG: hypothetical protein JSW00_00385 [Thermoplasmata archaeon]